MAADSRGDWFQIVGSLKIGYEESRFRHMNTPQQERAAPNKALQLTATSRSVYLCLGSYSAVVAVASRLPVAVAELGR